jgi:hypothetical protein
LPYKILQVVTKIQHPPIDEKWVRIVFGLHAPLDVLTVVDRNLSLAFATVMAISQ